MTFRKKFIPEEPSLYATLSDINHLAHESENAASKAVLSLEKVVSKIFNNNFDFNQQMTEKEHRFFCQIVNFILTKYQFAPEIHRAAALVRARYWARQCETDKALALYEKIEEQYPYHQRAYRQHESLLECLERTEEAKAVRLKYERVMQQFNSREEKKFVLVKPDKKEPPKLAEQPFSLFSCQDFSQFLSVNQSKKQALQSDLPLYNLFPVNS